MYKCCNEPMYQAASVKGEYEIYKCARCGGTHRHDCKAQHSSNSARFGGRPQGMHT